MTTANGHSTYHTTWSHLMVTPDPEVFLQGHTTGSPGSHHRVQMYESLALDQT
jgi:hypothetical protein